MLCFLRWWTYHKTWMCSILKICRRLLPKNNSQFRDNKKCIIAPLIRTHLKSIFGVCWWVVKGDLCSTAKLFSVSITAATAAQLSPPWFIMEMIGRRLRLYKLYNYHFTTLVGFLARPQITSQARRSRAESWKLWFIIFSLLTIKAVVLIIKIMPL